MRVHREVTLPTIALLLVPPISLSLRLHIRQNTSILYVIYKRLFSERDVYKYMAEYGTECPYYIYTWMICYKFLVITNATLEEDPVKVLESRQRYRSPVSRWVEIYNFMFDEMETTTKIRIRSVMDLDPTSEKWFFITMYPLNYFSIFIDFYIDDSSLFRFSGRVGFGDNC